MKNLGLSKEFVLHFFRDHNETLSIYAGPQARARAHTRTHTRAHTNAHTRSRAHTQSSFVQLQVRVPDGNMAEKGVYMCSTETHLRFSRHFILHLCC